MKTYAPYSAYFERKPFKFAWNRKYFRITVTKQNEIVYILYLIVFSLKYFDFPDSETQMNTRVGIVCYTKFPQLLLVN
jgi:hypothetical protein